MLGMYGTFSFTLEDIRSILFLEILRGQSSVAEINSILDDQFSYLSMRNLIRMMMNANMMG